ncbi:hypothetical protein ABTY98_36290 [Streptomyces sp. NPDC096040]|uniref:hypothetical protein n=1 Tax=Streptomyces sp. NPDC096040 TaxID=3155541 RepID=UPI003329A3AF
MCIDDLDEDMHQVVGPVVRDRTSLTRRRTAGAPAVCSVVRPTFLPSWWATAVSSPGRQGRAGRPTALRPVGAACSSGAAWATAPDGSEGVALLAHRLPRPDRPGRTTGRWRLASS